MAPVFDLQGHRGARGLIPENSFPSFEIAFDCGVTSIETDVHLTRDGVPVLCHDPRMPDGTPVATLDLGVLKKYRLDRNPDPLRFPNQQAIVTPVAQSFAVEHGFDPFSVPTLTEFLQFTADYAGETGRRAGKTSEQMARAARVRFDLELKRVPFYPEAVADRFDGTGPGLLEQRIVESVRTAGVVHRTSVRSFDHRCVKFIRQLEPELSGGVLVADTAPISPADLAKRADAEVYCPSFYFLDESLVRAAHAEGIRVIPWTVNEPDQWRRLLDLGVDGITTDFPDRLAVFLRDAGIPF